ncbi:hypothetical protein OC834_004869 [Tilletia horrida]|nr:hypothetical protein OC834_004869 [Tilletia horrida]
MHISRRGAVVLVAFAASSTATLFGDNDCERSLCISAVYNDQALSVSYVATFSGPSVGWVGIGQGDQMAGANMMRSTTAHTPPTTDQALTMPFVPNATTSFTNATMTVFAWTFPVRADFASKQTGHIWAVSRTSPGSMDPTSPIARHNVRTRPAKAPEEQTLTQADVMSSLLLQSHGNFNLDFTKALQVSAAAPGSQPSDSGLAGVGVLAPGPVILGPGAAAGLTGAGGKKKKDRGPKFRDLSNVTTRLFLAHMIIMSIAWMGFVAAGILVGRYGRTLFTSKWFPIHRGIQVSAVILITIGFALGVSAVHHSGSSHFDNVHKRTGLAMFILVWIQAFWGQISHVVRRATGIRVQNYGHILLGMILFFGLALWQIRTGLERWLWRPPTAVGNVFFPIWFAMITLIWLIGLVFLPREIKLNSGKAAEKKEVKGLNDAQQQSM